MNETTVTTVKAAIAAAVERICRKLCGPGMILSTNGRMPEVLLVPDMKPFAGNATPELAQRIANRLYTSLGGPHFFQYIARQDICQIPL